MARPKLKEKDKKKGLSISINTELLKELKKRVSNISAYIEKLLKDSLEE